jgi:hypothetical protein
LLRDTETTVGNYACNFPESIITDLAVDHLLGGAFGLDHLTLWPPTAGIKGTPARYSVEFLNIFSSNDGPVFDGESSPSTTNYIDALGNNDLDGSHLHLLGLREQVTVAGGIDARPGPPERAASVALEPGVDIADAEDVEEGGQHPRPVVLLKLTEAHRRGRGRR